MNLIKTSFYTSISQALSILGGLISVKVISTKIGPEGMAMTGQFLNTSSVFALFATGALGVGVVKYLAQFSNDKAMQLKIIRCAVIVMASCSLFVSIIVIFSSNILSTYAFKTEKYQSIYIYWGCFLLISTFSNLFASILNGLKLIKFLTIVNVTGTAVGVTITIVMANYFGVKGVLIASNFTALVLFCIHLYFLNKYRWFSFKELFGKIDIKVLRLFTAFILMTIVSGILVPAIQFFVRNKIISDFSFAEAGYWQSVTRISDYYLGFITSVLAVYYLPRLSEIIDRNELRKEIKQGYKIILPVVGVLSFSIWLCRYWIISILLTKEFMPSADLYAFQFLGDFFKIASWLLAYLMLAKSLKITFIISEIITSFVYVLLCYFFMNKYGLIGSVYGFCLTYFLYFIAMFIIMKKQEII